MSNTILKMGSTGTQVKELQALLNENGFRLDVDGVFGEKTQAAVRQYQAGSDLSVDGVVGNETWSSLTRAKAASAYQATTAGNGAASGLSTQEILKSVEAERPVYVPSAALEAASELLAQTDARRPAAYVGRYQSQIDVLLDNILSGGTFRYDPTTDPAWQAYREQYTQAGRQASLDTLGNAASLTGGRLSSYAQTASAQAYQQYMTALTARLPELEQRAYGRYKDERSELYDQAAMLLNLDDTEYARYRDGVRDWQDERDTAYGRYRDLSQAEWEAYRQFQSEWEKNRSYYYAKATDEAAAAFAQQQFEAAQAAQAAKAASGGGGGGGGGSAKTKRTLTFQNYLTRASNQFNSEGPQGLQKYLYVNRDASGEKGLTEEEISLICKQFGYRDYAALSEAAKEKSKTKTSSATASKTAAKNKNTTISIR